MSDWLTVTAEEPCPACHKADWCAWSPDGHHLKCERTSVAPPGYARRSVKDGGAVFRPDIELEAPPRPRRSMGRSPLDWDQEVARLHRQLTPSAVETLAHDLGLTTPVLQALGIGWATSADLKRMHAGGQGWKQDYPSGAYAFPEYGGDGAVVGLTLRTADGRKGGPSSEVGARRGIVMPSAPGQGEGPVLVVEGVTDVAAALVLGLPAVGRPSAASGVADLAQLLEGRSTLVVGENDEKPDGAWPGRDGAAKVARELAEAWGSPVPYALPPGDAKDLRAWLQLKVQEGLDLNQQDECRAAGQELLGALQRSEHSNPPPQPARDAQGSSKPSQADLVVELAQRQYRFGRSTEDEPFAVPLEGPLVVKMLRGGRDSLRASLARDFAAQQDRIPNQAALADALLVLEGEAARAEGEPLHLRVGPYPAGLVLDLGDATGQVVMITTDSWELAPRPPLLFRRTELTRPLPVPAPSGDIELLRGFINIGEADWPLLVAWMVAALLPDMPVPIALLGGQQGTGKSTAAGFLVGLLDPSAAPLQSPPKTPKKWVAMASGSRVIALDNISRITDEMSDAMCRAVTGDATVVRRLYTDGSLFARNFRRALILTSIDPGAIRGDLAERLVLFDLEPIPANRRRLDATLRKDFDEALPAILAGLLDLMVQVLARLPHLATTGYGRMADFERVIMAVDDVLGTQGLATYRSQAGRIAQDVVESDSVAEAIVHLMETHNCWRGTMKELLSGLTPEPPPRGWPRSPRGLSGRVKRAAPALQQVGVEVVLPSPTDKTRTYQLLRTASAAEGAGGRCE